MADVVTLTETWCDRDGAIGMALRLVADRSASWLDSAQPQLLLPAGQDRARRCSRKCHRRRSRAREGVSRERRRGGAGHAARDASHVPGARLLNDITGKRADAKTCSPSCRNALSLALRNLEAADAL